MPLRHHSIRPSIRHGAVLSFRGPILAIGRATSRLSRGIRTGHSMQHCSPHKGQPTRVNAAMAAPKQSMRPPHLAPKSARTHPKHGASPLQGRPAPRRALPHDPMTARRAGCHMRSRPPRARLAGLSRQSGGAHTGMASQSVSPTSARASEARAHAKSGPTAAAVNPGDARPSCAAPPPAAIPPTDVALESNFLSHDLPLTLPVLGDSAVEGSGHGPAGHSGGPGASTQPRPH
jgi:hypothetical protein